MKHCTIKKRGVFLVLIFFIQVSVQWAGNFCGWSFTGTPDIPAGVNKGGEPVLPDPGVNSRPMHEIYTSSMSPYLSMPAKRYHKKMKVLVLAYLPTEDGVHLDESITGIKSTLEKMKVKIERMSGQAKYMLEEGSKYKGYKKANARPFLGYEVVDFIFVYDTLPAGLVIGWEGDGKLHRPDYRSIIETWNGRHYVESVGVDEIWLWGWHHGNIVPAESNMASPRRDKYCLNGDVSNSEHTDDLPVFGRTYVLYNYNYGRSANEAVHNHMHQLENMLWHISKLTTGSEAFIREKFSGWQNWDRPEERIAPIGAAGDCHHPVNTSKDYDYCNEIMVLSDIEDWNPERSGKKKLINCNTWYEYYKDGWPEGFEMLSPVLEGKPGSTSSRRALTEAAWYIYWMQNVPGKMNGIRFGEFRLSNWLGFKADWDKTISGNVMLYY